MMLKLGYALVGLAIACWVVWSFTFPTESLERDNLHLTPLFAFLSLVSGTFLVSYAHPRG